MPKIQKDKELKALQDFDSLLIGENQYLDPSPEGDFLTEETKELKILYNNIIKTKFIRSMIVLNTFFWYHNFFCICCIIN